MTSACARRLDDSERDGLRNRNHQHRAVLVRDLGNRCDVFDRAEEIRRLDQHASGFRSDRLLEFFQVDAAIVVETCDRERHALMRRVGRQHFAIFGMQAARHDHRPPAGQADGHHHAFGRRRRTVIHGGVRDFHAGQLADHRLKFEDRLQRALRNLRLIGRVGGEKFAARNQRINNDRAVVKVGAGAQKTGVSVAVLARALAEEVDDFRFRHLARNLEVAGQAVFGGNRRKQIVDRAQANGFQHGFAVGRRFR